MDLKLLTKDNEVSDASLIQVKYGRRSTDPVLTLTYIDNQLNTLRADLEKRQAEISDLEALRSEMVPLIATIKLKEPEPKTEEEKEIPSGSPD
jgi:hypothetical protein